MAKTAEPVRVSIIDDHPVVIEGIRAWLSVEPRVHIEHVGHRVPPYRSEVDVVIIDLNLDGRLVVDDIAALAEVGQRVIAFSQFTEEELVLSTLDAGAYAFVAKSEGADHLLTTVFAVAEGRPYVTPTAAGVLASDRRPDAPILSERERTALLWWFQSMSKASVASRMGISPHTVDMYIRRARLKYAQVGRAAPTKADMLVRAIEDGLVTADEIAEGCPTPVPPVGVARRDRLRNLAVR
ncbi:response regulator [Phytohabitans houttuyneae]|uniref:DNA-binding response regulator n=1 Tax=Phytohabitans houttuyneae TaxID=1076126 RepID=A0A6V8KDT0_9ACTN|nr:response regulator transcription factor [Phytohabitans houttuyneae]GFJ83373.1 DNA-binding response regulator [Phytohabitans houttuyneae]